MSDIVKRLRRAFSDESFADDKLHRDTADLIERQAAEIEALNSINETLLADEKLAQAYIDLREAQAEIERQAAEIERLSKELGECSGGFDTGTKLIEYQKAEIGRLREALKRARQQLGWTGDEWQRNSERAVKTIDEVLNAHQEQPSDDPAKS